MLSELGRSRYAEFVDFEPSKTPIQVTIADGVIRYVGVPRAGDMHRLETRLAEVGVQLEENSWQP